MKQINKLITNPSKNLLKYSPSKAILRISQEAKSLVDLLFIAFEEHVKYFKINHPCGYDDAKREWIKTFVECGVTKENVQKGIKTMRSNGVVYASITPAEFLELCFISPSDIGAPNFNDAYLEACRNSHPSMTEKKWSHKAVRHACYATGSHFLITESESKSREVFYKNYKKSCEMAFEGLILDQIENKIDENIELSKQKLVVKEEFKDLNNPLSALNKMKQMLR